MGSTTFIRRTRIAAPAEVVFRWHARPGALERLTPPWTKVQVLERVGGIENGARVVLRMPVGPTHVRWVAEHFDYIEGQQFRDRQIEGPFALWDHTHRFAADGPDGCVLEDRIEYALPLGAAGALLGGAFVRSMLDRMFAYRHRVTVSDIGTHATYGGTPLHCLVSGASGLVGSALVPFLTTGGHSVTRLVRAQSRANAATVHWDPATGALEGGHLDPVDVVIHLAGESIASGRWSDATKQRISASRGQATQRLCETLLRLTPRPKVLICASAIGIYGDHGAEWVDESTPPGAGFLADVCKEWEAATDAAAAGGIRVVNLRLGVVLTPAGGALAKLRLPFLLGIGGRLGSGAQYMSWISLDDLLGMLLHAARTDSLHGPLNAVAPAPVTNRAFTTALGYVLHRPTLFPVPAAAARLAFGEMADEMLLGSTRVHAKTLTESGFQFHYPDLEGALRHVLGRTGSSKDLGAR